MRIGFDAKRAFCNTTGLGNYSRTLIKGLRENLPQDDFYLYTPKKKIEAFHEDDHTFIKMPETLFQKQAHPIWRRNYISKLIRDHKIDLYHGLSNELPVGIEKSKAKSIVTIHDLIFLHYPDQFPWVDRRQYNKKFRHACDVADTIFACSEHTRKDIIELFKIDPAKVHVTYQSCDPIFYEQADEDKKLYFTKKHQLPENYLLFVGSLVKRKSPQRIIQALARAKSDIPLIVVGKGPMRSELERLSYKFKLSERIIFLDVPFIELPLLYQNASAFVYPSVYEGFGIPVLEALYSKIPVITSNLSCLPEVAGEHSIQIDPDNVDLFAHEIDKVLEDQGLRERMISLGHEHALKFNNQDLTQRVVSLYQQTLK